MRRLGAFQAEGHAERLSQHLALPLEDRVRRSLALSAAMMPSSHAAKYEDDPTPLYDRARYLGLYNP